MRKIEGSSASGGTGRQGLWAISDQASVSAANFLTIAIGAWLLPLPEQGKLVYVYTIYIALVLFNAAALFSAAPIMRYEVADAPAYRRHLLRAQTGIAFAGATLAAAVFALAGPKLDWTPVPTELVGLMAFLGLQQMADFNRRAEYVFGHTGMAAVMSGLGLALRVGALLAVRPADAGTLFFLLALSAVPGALAAFTRGGHPADAVPESGVLGRHLHIARWNIAGAPLRWSGLHLPVLLVGALAGAGPAAILASIRSVGTFANVFLELFETYIPAWLARRANHDGENALKSAMSRLYVIGATGWAVVLVVIALIGERILDLLLGPAYSAYWPVLLLLWVGNGLHFAGRAMGIRYRIARLASVEFSGAVGGALALLAGFPLIAALDLYGGAWAIMLAQAGLVIAQVVHARRISRSQTGMNR